MTVELKPTLHEIIKLNIITLSQTNPRTYFNKEAMAELTDSIRRHGVLQPILVRPMKHGGYEVVAGHRRYLASLDAGCIDIPATVRELHDIEALEIQVIENLQRADLHPLEEAEGYQQLLTHGYYVKDIALKVGKSKGYVYARLKLSNAGGVNKSKERREAKGKLRSAVFAEAMGQIVELSEISDMRSDFLRVLSQALIGSAWLDSVRLTAKRRCIQEEKSKGMGRGGVLEKSIATMSPEQVRGLIVELILVRFAPGTYADEQHKIFREACRLHDVDLKEIENRIKANQVKKKAKKKGE